mmetsp:Transcript_11066/g.37671  ORF Transcript_11066/g.37671 Transcript_11066/m.37671 type:complete len:366 (-) Transcript_11066:143-1240(-)
MAGNAALPAIITAAFGFGEIQESLSRAALPPSIQRYVCSPEEVQLRAAAFHRAAGEREDAHARGCPSLEWTTTAAAFGCGRESTGRAIVVGGNKGYDCVGWLRYFHGRDREGVSAHSWKEDLTRILKSPRIECGACGQCRTEYSQLTSPTTSGPATVDCIEALRANADVLKAMSRRLNWRGKGLNSVHAAATSDTSTRSVKLPRGAYGEERMGIGITTRRGQAGARRVWVPTVTVDELVFGFSADRPAVVKQADLRVPAVLTVDTEGNDALVLQGATKTLASGLVGAVEFEYHSKGAWARRRLRDTIGFLDGFGFDCFYQTRRNLHRITGCWNESYEIRSWSNVLCANRAQPCWHKAITAHEERT